MKKIENIDISTVWGNLLTYDIIKMELAGVEPASRHIATETSTLIVLLFHFASS